MMPCFALLLQLPEADVLKSILNLGVPGVLLVGCIVFLRLIDKLQKQVREDGLKMTEALIKSAQAQDNLASILEDLPDRITTLTLQMQPVMEQREMLRAEIERFRTEMSGVREGLGILLNKGRR